MNKADFRTVAARSALINVLVIGIFAAWGGWERRWMSDDGLIVLRTVRNLIAGNGPVFNKGERVEANTSTVWQYLIYAGERVTGFSLEHIALVEALGLSILAMALGAYASSRVFKAHIVLPFGGLIYLALPPARDFFTSGLEWGLAIFYLAVLWALMVWWARPVTAGVIASGRMPSGRSAGRRDTGRIGSRHSDASRHASLPGWPGYLLAFWAGLSWLVRPELALYGAATGLILFLVHRSGRAWLGILAAALPLPLAYEIFRMGYYGLLTPHTAVAKSAAGAEWGSGVRYLENFVSPYWLWLPVIVVVCAGAYFLRAHACGRMALALAVMVGCALLHAVYVLRVGGDFMHGRMLLLPLFALLLPVFVLPMPAARCGLVALGASLAAALWALIIVLRGHPVDWNTYDTQPLTIVDERDFWTHATQREPGDPPKSTVDFRYMPLINGYLDGLEGIRRGDAMAVLYLKDEANEIYDWMGIPRQTGRDEPGTVYMVNLGMTSMNAPLDVRVLDNIGLSTPLAARQPREAGERIGHDKDLPREWQVADSGVDLDKLPPWIDKDEAKLSREALATPTFQELFATYRDPLTVDRFLSNIKWALTKGRTLQLSSDPRDYLGG